MKRISASQLASIIRRKEKRRKIVLSRIKTGERLFDNITVQAPRMLSFSRNSRETLDFLRDFKEKALLRKRVLKRGKLVEPYLFVDLAPIEQMSLPAAVILAAELHRWALLKSANLRPKNLKAWSPRVKHLLNSLGALSLLGIHKTLPIPSSAKNEIVLIQLETGVRNDGEAIDRLQQKLATWFELFEPQPYIFEGLSEAVVNTIDHAYAEEKTQPKYPYAGHRWWAAACIDPVKHSLRFFVYDQGIGIPQTLASKPEWKKLVDGLLAKTGVKQVDADVILGALTVGRTRTGLDERGKGLRQMQEVIHKAGDGYMRILSGHGDIKLTCNEKVEKASHNSHIGGTLVEWSIPYAVFESFGRPDETDQYRE